MHLFIMLYMHWTPLLRRVVGRMKPKTPWHPFKWAAEDQVGINSFKYEHIGLIQSLYWSIHFIVIVSKFPVQCGLVFTVGALTGLKDRNEVCFGQCRPYQQERDLQTPDREISRT